MWSWPWSLYLVGKGENYRSGFEGRKRHSFLVGACLLQWCLLLRLPRTYFMIWLSIKCSMKADYPRLHEGLDSTQPQHKQSTPIFTSEFLNEFLLLHSHWDITSIDTIYTSRLSLFLIHKADLNHLPLYIFSFLVMFTV